MIPYVVGEWKYGMWDDPFYIENIKQIQKNKERIREYRSKYGKKIQCLNDNKEFLSIGEASKYYGINYESIRKSISENRPILIKKYKREYQFVAI